jgi:uncharacterized membrane protein
MGNMRNASLIAVAYAASALLYSKLPDVQWWVDPVGTSARLLIAFLLPTAALLILGLLSVLTRKDPFRDEEDTLAIETTDAIVSAGILFVLALHFLILAMLFTAAAWVSAAVLLLGGLLLAFVGNALPRTRPNIVVGIRTERTLTDRRVWLRTHRLLGNIAVVLGVAVGVAAFLPHRFRMLLVSAVLVVGLCAIAVLTRKHSHV